MAQYDHLPLIRQPILLERRKRPGFGINPAREQGSHGAKVKTGLDAAVADARRPRAENVDPSLILRVKLSGLVADEDWERLGLEVLSRDPDKTVVLFSSDSELTKFRARVDAYLGPVPEGQKHPVYAGIINAIDEVGPLTPGDRIGRRLRAAGFTSPANFGGAEPQLVDIEIWDIGTAPERAAKAQMIEHLIEHHGGEAFDRHIGQSLTLVRARVTAAAMPDLLDLPEIAVVDYPPQVDTEASSQLDLDLGALPVRGPPPGADAPLIGVIDSGINDHPLLENVLVGAISASPAFGPEDARGHGTRVAGIAAFGDIRAQLAEGHLDPYFRICSARVLNEHGQFDPGMLAPTAMREAISRLNAEFGCRLFVVSLGDLNGVYDGGKVGQWASALDELAREFNAVIVVSSGNRTPRQDLAAEESLTHYPAYLMEPENRVLEPANALNVVTVGSLAGASGLDEARAHHVSARTITEALEPSPFTRAGPGPNDAIKPDFVDIGGTSIWDPVAGQMLGGKDVASAGVLTLNHQPVQRLFASASGTSFAAPRVAQRAAFVMQRFPTASANLVRALLALSADIPDAASAKLSPIDKEAPRLVCGYGAPDQLRATFSDDPRVIHYAEDELQLDHFALYEVFIPEVFQKERGERSLTVALAFDPPVRHTRADYAGATMSFRLFRGCEPDLLVEFFRSRTKAEGKRPDIEGRFECKLEPSPERREGGTLQKATQTYKRNVSTYGERYFLVVRCENVWANSVMTHQRYAVAVEISHKAQISLYARIRERLRLRS